MKTPMNKNLLQKIAAYLCSREGCTVESVEPTVKGLELTIHDAFGFRYRLEIRTVGRNQTEHGEGLKVGNLKGVSNA